MVVKKERQFQFGLFLVNENCLYTEKESLWNF